MTQKMLNYILHTEDKNINLTKEDFEGCHFSIQIGNVVLNWYYSR